MKVRLAIFFQFFSFEFEEVSPDKTLENVDVRSLWCLDVQAFTNILPADLTKK